MLMPANASNPVVHFVAGRHPGKIGWLIGPSARSKTRLRPWIPYALDNDAYTSFRTGVDWSEQDWLALLKWAAVIDHKPLWALVPDVVASRAGTLAKWQQFAPVVDRFGFSKAFAVQDGMGIEDVPKNADVVFVGGTTEWKWRSLPQWCTHFESVHVGRVNSIERLMVCQELGVKSVDGTGWFRATDGGRQARGLWDWMNGSLALHPELFPRGLAS